MKIVMIELKMKIMNIMKYNYMKRNKINKENKNEINEIKRIELWNEEKRMRIIIFEIIE